MIVVAGHGEYGYDPHVVTVLWDPDDDGVWNKVVNADDQDRIARQMFVNETGLAPPDGDLTWEQVWKVEGDVAGWFEALLADLAERPSGDDTVFDYWPSGVRLARQVARALGREAEVELVVADVTEAIGWPAAELGLMTVEQRNLTHVIADSCDDPDCELHHPDVAVEEGAAGETAQAWYLAGAFELARRFQQQIDIQDDPSVAITVALREVVATQTGLCPTCGAPLGADGVCSEHPMRKESN